MQSGLKRVLLGAVTGLIVSGGALAYMDYWVSSDHAEKMEQQERRIDIEKAHFISMRAINEKYDGEGKEIDVSNWTYDLQDMPSSKERTDFSNSVIEATKDNIITDSEYSALEEGFVNLSNINIMSDTRKAAAKYVLGADLNTTDANP